MISKYMIAFLTVVFLSGCQLLSSPQPYEPPEPVKIITVEVQPEIYQPPFPQPVRLEDVRWFVITQDNLQEKISEIEKLTGGNLVIYAITPHDYENFAHNFQEVRRYIRQLQNDVIYYRETTAKQE